MPLSDTLLVVVGRGSSDPDANSNVAKVTRLLWEGFGFGWAETAYSGVTFPLVEPGLRHAVKLGFKREGFRRDACMKGGRLVGVHVLGITRAVTGV